MTIKTFIAVGSFFLLLYSCKPGELKTATIENGTGLRLYEKGEYKRALYFFMKAAAHENLPDSNKAIFFANIAHAYANIHQADSAKYFYKKASEAYLPGSVNATLSMVNLFLIDEKIDSAKRYLELAYSTDSSSGEVNNLLGLIYIGDYGQAYYNPEKAYKFNNKAFLVFRDAASKFALAKNEYFLNNVDKSITLFSQLRRENPGNENYLVSLILIKIENGDLSNMNFLVRELKNRFPRSYSKVISQLSVGKHAVRWNL